MKRIRTFLADRIGLAGALASVYGCYRLGARLTAFANRIGVKRALVVAAFLGISFSARAASISCTEVPVLTPDGVAVCADSPGLGRNIVAIPGATAFVAFNDNLGRGDFDFSDAWLSVVFVPNADGLVSATVKWIGEDSALTNAAGVVGYGLVSDARPGPVFSGIYAIDSTVVAEILTGDGRRYYSGPASINPDCTVHAWVSETPEPAAWLMIALGLGLMSVRLIWLARRA